MKTTWVLVEYYAPNASARRPVEGFGLLELSSEEAGEMNRRMVLTPCRVFPAKYFPDIVA